MRRALALAAALLAAPAAAADRLPPALRPDPLQLRAPGISSSGREAQGARDPCVADVCAAAVSVPGFEPRLSLKGRRTELALAALDRLHLEPFATVAWWLVVTGLRVDYAPGIRADAAPAGRGGGARFQALFRWRLDALNRPVLPVRHHG